MLYARVLAVATRGVRYASLENDPQELILTMTDGYTLNLGRVQGRGIDHVEVLSSGKLKFYYDDGSEPEIVGEDVYSALHALMVAAQEAATDAINAKNETIINANAAHGYARDANRAKTAAETAQGLAEAAQEAAETAQGKAEDAQGAAEDAQEAAEDAQEAAEAAQDAAEDAQEAAETAQGKAEDAQTAAEAAQTAAETAAATFETDKTLTVVDKAADAKAVGLLLNVKNREVTASADDYKTRKYNAHDGSVLGSAYNSIFIRSDKTDAKILKNVLQISTDTGYYFSIFGYKADDTFVGYWHGDGTWHIATSDSNADKNYKVTVIDTAKLFVEADYLAISVCKCSTAEANTSYPGFWKVATPESITTSDAAKVTYLVAGSVIDDIYDEIDEIKLDIVTDKTLAESGRAADGAVVGKAILRLEKEINTLGSVTALESDWEQGAISYTNGSRSGSTASTHTHYIRTKSWTNGIPENVYAVTAGEGYTVTAYGYTGTGSQQSDFLGLWNGTGFVKSDRTDTYKTSINLDTLRNNGATVIRLTMSDEDITQTIEPEDGDNLTYTVKESKISDSNLSGDILPTLDYQDRLYIDYDDGEPHSSVNFRCYLLNPTGYSKVYAHLYASGYNDTGSAAIAFYSGEIDQENYMASASIPFQSGWRDYEAEIPEGCENVAIFRRMNASAGDDPWIKVPQDELVMQIYGAEKSVPGNVAAEAGRMYAGSLLLRKELPEAYTDVPEDPDAYDDDAYIDEKIVSVPKGVSFIFTTDEHWEDSPIRRVQPMLAYVRQRLNIKPVLCGGDVIDGQATKFLAKQVGTDYTVKMLAEFGGNYMFVTGNHDANMANYDRHDPPYTEEELAAKWFPPAAIQKYMTDPLLNAVCPDYDARIEAITSDNEERAQLKAYFKLTYYVDYPDLKTRFLVVNTGNPDYGVVYDLLGTHNYNEVYLTSDFVYQAISTTPTGYNIVVAGHWFMNYSDRSTGTGLGFLDPGESVNKMLQGLKTKTAVRVQIKPHFSESETGQANKAKYLAWCEGVPFYVTGSGESNKSLNFRQANDVGTAMMITGHEHVDDILFRQYNDVSDTYTPTRYTDQTINQSLGEVPCVLVQTDNLAKVMPSVLTHTMTEDTVTDQCFDVVTITDGGIVLTRFGAGNDRTIQISNS